ncbi:MAG TPA: Ig-like domain-containing protein [Brumimicrobium sp.]|nr:Ig-like domain-containing protein [Brumimicrobium sp.]
MARFYSISFLLLGIILLASCGQVGTITGGEVDNSAPKVLVDKVSPPMSSTTVFPEKISIPFDEFIELNRPAENIRVAPEDVRLNYAIKKKTLELTIREGEWKPNTTYTIYLNRAVKDITESNDSIMSYVFSTGSFIDSLQTAIQIRDALTGKVAEGITVGLYASLLEDDTSKVNPRYYATTNKDGIATFYHIKDTVFYAYAFEDENRNNRLDATEKRAKLEEPISLHFEDSVEIIGPVIRLMPPEETELKIANNEVIPPAAWCIGFNRSLREDESFEPLITPKHTAWNDRKDSVTFYYENIERSGEYRGVLTSLEKIDTLSKKFFFRTDASLTVGNNLKNKKLGVADTLILTLNDPFQEIDTNHIKLYQIAYEDSVISDLTYQIIPLSVVEFGILFSKEKQKEISVKISPEGISGLNVSLKDSIKLDFSLQEKRETGNLIVEFDSLPPYGILYVTQQGSKEEFQIVFNGIDKQTHVLEHLPPGQYEFKYLLDEDRNGKWSTGSIFTGKEAEVMMWLPEISTIRANWDVKTTLHLSPSQKE